MEKTKKLITLTEKQLDMIGAIMEQDGVDSLSVAIGYLIMEEAKRRNILPIIK